MLLTSHDDANCTTAREAATMATAAGEATAGSEKQTLSIKENDNWTTCERNWLLRVQTVAVLPRRWKMVPSEKSTQNLSEKRSHLEWPLLQSRISLTA